MISATNSTVALCVHQGEIPGVGRQSGAGQVLLFVVFYPSGWPLLLTRQREAVESPVGGISR